MFFLAYILCIILVAGKPHLKLIHSKQYTHVYLALFFLEYLTCKKLTSRVDYNRVLRKPSWHILRHKSFQSTHYIYLIHFKDCVTGITSDTVECIKRIFEWDHRSMSLIRRITLLPSGLFYALMHTFKGACFIFVIISRLLLSFALHSIHYLSFDVICFVNKLFKKGEIVGAISAYLVF